MSNPSEKQIDEALRVLALYQRALVHRMAEEIVERQEDFATPFVGGAEMLIDKYYHLLACICPIISNLQAYAHKAAPSEDSRLLGNDQFRCFRCQNVISENADSCPYCGWTWEGPKAR